MRDIRVSDITMREAAASKALSLSFKEKLEIVKILDRIGVAAIEVLEGGQPANQVDRLPGEEQHARRSGEDGR